MRNEIRSDRLLLRQWHDEDRAPFAAMNADSCVMAHFPAPLSREQSDALVDRIELDFRRRGFGLWALEVQDTAEFIGFAGLSVASFSAHFTPAVEIGWRLALSAWGKGYATEAAGIALDYGFTSLALAEVVSFTATGNLRSRAVMRRIGMAHDPTDDFDHPSLPAEHVLRRHVLYRVSLDRWHRQRCVS